MSLQPLILDIKGNSLDDGTGIRSVIFFKGCPLDCLWCQNPESKQMESELSWDCEKCTGCETCIAVCKAGAISRENPGFIDRSACTLCFECVEACPSTALSRLGKLMSAEEIVQKVLRYRDFFAGSGGGVTLSGGEPTLYMDFVSALLQLLKKEGIHTLVETCGHFSLDKFKEKLLPWLDEIYMDIKLIDSTKHKQFCGVSNQIILENFCSLNVMSQDNRFAFMPRTPLIPGITDGKAQIRELAEFYTMHGIKRIGVMVNNPIWLHKLKKIGRRDNFDNPDQIRNFYDEERKNNIIELFSKYGIIATLS